MNEDETIVADNATELMWEKSDGGVTYTWSQALEHCEDLELGYYTDWRLPDNKELQSIVKYVTTDVPAINTDYFDITFNEDYDIDNIYGDGGDYGWFWSSTTLGISLRMAVTSHLVGHIPILIVAIVMELIMTIMVLVLREVIPKMLQISMMEVGVLILPVMKSVAITMRVVFVV
ncbi:Lcl C-terminal domain-containing protein [Vibrio algarum]|uniref:DUF1566 domain-containing protein n=1 Tax=Vibrio algarum TaxID=3020714 RepID=A0ABT4YU05_9VIBR|nr:DUF1566 domain-containing protein [Vibrio sp. KJ40-1]MDB1125013.1 DUF1566 domain-containing protein [Vibrio sp. KJ40-1]